MTMRVTVALRVADEGETPLQVCWHNLLFADRMHSLELFLASAQAWLRLTQSNYQALERELRTKDCDTHLIAATLDKGRHYSLRHNPQPCRFYCLASCRERTKALEELHKHATSYDENFERLAEAGDIELGAAHLNLVEPQGENIFTVLEACRHRLTFSLS